MKNSVRSENANPMESDTTENPTRTALKKAGKKNCVNDLKESYMVGISDVPKASSYYLKVDRPPPARGVTLEYSKYTFAMQREKIKRPADLYGCKIENFGVLSIFLRNI
jgi:hypothetical protein